MKRISGQQYFLDLFTNSTNYTNIFYFGVYNYVKWSKGFARCFGGYMLGEYIVWWQKIINLIGQYRLRENEGRFRWYTATQKLPNTPAVIFSYPCRAGGLS